MRYGRTGFLYSLVRGVAFTYRNIQHLKLETRVISALTFVLAPLPNAIFARCGGDDFSTEYDGSGPVDLGRFITATVVVTGFALPLVLAHSEVITKGACVMSIAGGGYAHIESCSHLFLTFYIYSLVYGTIMAYSQTFKEGDSDYD